MWCIDKLRSHHISRYHVIHVEIFNFQFNLPVHDARPRKTFHLWFCISRKSSNEKPRADSRDVVTWKQTFYGNGNIVLQLQRAELKEKHQTKKREKFTSNSFKFNILWSITWYAQMQHQMLEHLKLLLTHQDTGTDCEWTNDMPSWWLWWIYYVRIYRMQFVCKTNTHTHKRTLVESL